MSDKEILVAACKKALENGWTEGDFFLSPMHVDEIASKLLWGQFLFDHYFAIAFFGEQDTCSLCGGTEVKGITIQTDYGTGEEHDAICNKCGSAWLDKIEFPDEGFVLPAYFYHLQQMVIARDQIKYLEKFLE